MLERHVSEDLLGRVQTSTTPDKRDHICQRDEAPAHPIQTAIRIPTRLMFPSVLCNLIVSLTPFQIIHYSDMLSCVELLQSCGMVNLLVRCYNMFQLQQC